MTMQTDLFRGPRYWWAAYCRFWRNMNDGVGVFCFTWVLLMSLILLQPGYRGWLIVSYWMASLQVCYDNKLSARFYRAWAALGAVMFMVFWSSFASEPLFSMIHLIAIGFSLCWAYTAHQRRYWARWWLLFTRNEFDPDDNRSLTTDELIFKFGLGQPVKPTPREVENFLCVMKRQGYIDRQQLFGSARWREADIGNSHRVLFFLNRGVVPPHEAWVLNYIIKHDPDRKLLIREPA